MDSGLNPRQFFSPAPDRDFLQSTERHDGQKAVLVQMSFIAGLVPALTFQFDDRFGRLLWIMQVAMSPWYPDRRYENCRPATACRQCPIDCPAVQPNHADLFGPEY